MADDNALNPPARSKGDLAHTLAKGLAGSLPVVGAAAAEAFQALVQPPLERRRDEWMRLVAATLEELKDRQGVAVEDLQNNEVFVDTVLQATSVAMRNSSNEKRRALRNAVANAALPYAPEESEQQMFLQMVDRFTVWHLRMLALFDDPAAWCRAQKRTPREYFSADLATVLEEAFPDLKGRREFYDQVWRDLHGSGLVTTDGLHAMMTGDGLMRSRTSSRGKAFLKFISEPSDGGAHR